MKKLLLGVISFYQRWISPLLGPRCRFQPCCSQYFRQCLQRWPLHWAVYYGCRRLLKCHPLHPGGVDLPPTQTSDIIEGS